MGLGDPYDIFVTTYIQTHVLYGIGVVKFDEVIKFAINEECRMLSSDSGTIMLAYRLKNKVKGKGKSVYSYDDFEYN